MQICLASWPSCFQRSSFLTLSVQHIFKILLKNLLTNVCSLLLDDFVFLHVSEPYNRTLFTLELEILSEVFHSIDSPLLILTWCLIQFLHTH